MASSLNKLNKKILKSVNLFAGDTYKKMKGKIIKK